MIRVDRRAGSAPLFTWLQRADLPAELTLLEFGDLEFIGRGPEGRPVSVGIEVKTLADLLNSLTTGRLMGHQIPGMLSTFEHVYLVVSGFYRVGSDGCIEIRIGRDWQPLRLGGRTFLYRDLAGLLSTLEIRCGVHVRETRTTSHHDTVAVVAGIYHWWTSKAFEEHRSHLAFHEIPDNQIQLTTPPLVVRMAKELPGVGYKRAYAVGKVFPTPTALLAATEQQWRSVEGIGPKLAGQIVQALRGAR